MNVSKHRKTRKNKKIQKTPKTSKLFHFYDDKVWAFEGITFSNDGTHIDHMMCSGNIICHKIKDRDDIQYTKKEVETLLQRYISKISKPGMRDFIKYRHLSLQSGYAESQNSPFFHPDAGMTNADIYPLCDPNLRNIIVGFDMDDTLHQLGYLFNIPNKQLIAAISALTHSTITYNDIGEMYFGGKERLARCKVMFQNLAKTIGIENVYIITANPSSLLLEIIPDLYSKIFNITFPKENVKVATHGQLSKYAIIKDILSRV